MNYNESHRNQPCCSVPSKSFTAANFLDFLEEKVESVRRDTANSPRPTFGVANCVFSEFEPCSGDEIRRIIQSAPTKSCASDPAPTFIVKEFLDELLPLVTCMCNSSIREGYLPMSQKCAVITPRLKKDGLDSTDMKNFRPISNLTFMSKVVEKVVAGRLLRYLAENDLLPKLQSGFRRFHSTETAILKVMSDVYAVVDRGEVALLALLDVSAAFDTVDHDILLQRLATSFGITGIAYKWFQSFVTGRFHAVCYGDTTTPSRLVRSGVPQGSVLGPILYVLYTADVIDIVESLGLGVHLYADDTQLYASGPSIQSLDIAGRVLKAVDLVRSWMSSNRLRLNPDKTQFSWFGTRQQLANRDMLRLSEISPALVSEEPVRDLGVLLDSEMTLEAHVAGLCRSCFYQLRRLRIIRHSLSRAAVSTLVHAFICNRIDYCNAALFGASAHLLDRLQSVLRAAARLILNVGKYDHITSAIRHELHWLPVPQRLQFKLCVLVRGCLKGVAPSYLDSLIKPASGERFGRTLRSTSHGDLMEPRFRTVRYGRRGFSVCAPRIWNDLPMHVRDLSISNDQFKILLKTFFFEQSLSQHKQRF